LTDQYAKQEEQTFKGVDSQLRRLKEEAEAKQKNASKENE